jgi:Transposase DDE domain
MRWIGAARFPSRSTYCERYRRAHFLFQVAVRLQGDVLLRKKIGDARCVAVDKSLVPSLGPAWPRRLRVRGTILPGVDRDSAWGFSKYHGWVQGYSYEVLVSAGQKGLVLPLRASVDRANWSEHRSFRDHIAELPASTKYVLADAGYDSDEHADAIELDSRGRPTGRRFLCPQVYRRGEHRRPLEPYRDRHLARRKRRHRRQQRARYLETKMARRLYARRNTTAEPFNDWFKSSFHLHDRAWHRGLDNNRTQILGALFAYQLLARYNRRQGNHHGQLQWILDGL